MYYLFDEFKFGQTIEDLEKAKLIYRMVSYFANLDLHPEVVSDRVLSDAYEELIFKFASSVNEKAGEFMTPRDAVRLATKLVLAADEEIFDEKNERMALLRRQGGSTKLAASGGLLGPVVQNRDIRLQCLLHLQRRWQ